MKKYKDIDEYIADTSGDVKNRLVKLRKVIHKAASGLEESISYGMPTFKLNGKNLVHFAAFKNHIGLFPTPSGVTEFKKELADYKTSKGTIQFQNSQPTPYDLVTKIVKFRAKENLAKYGK